MSNNRMLIDATHPEETRVVVLRGGRVEEFDFESAARKLLRGNIYLAKVTRVEPSLQAAFVDYGGNRHGFLAFNEIHPDYYQIPMADRQALLEQEAAEEAREDDDEDGHVEHRSSRRRDDAGAEDLGDEPDQDEPHDGDDARDQHSSDADERPAPLAQHVVLSSDDSISEPPPETVGGFEPSPPAEEAGEASNGNDVPHAVGLVEEEGVQEVEANGASEAESVEQVGSEDALEELPTRPRRRARSYKIQEVIKRRQIILVQVVKEERGTKGAALTTYLSLAGRYTVLMPNTARGGGISRKITNPQDRKRLKAIAQELEVPEGMGLIIRTAGAARTKQEIKRDFEYLLRLWESVREVTLQSTAPSLVYEEGNLIKRSIRDLYNKDVEEVIVAGAEAHREAHDFMRMLMPSHAKNVIEYQEGEPLFTRFQIERQLNAMFSPYVTLRSGGYLVINQTEALVAIDVNSGKSTREFSIEETALNTNLEASDEIARQLKLRDLAGLIVIDFIDMEEKRHNRAVERRLKDALRFDRARIQVGRISHFGLMEMSRQRLRTGVLEGSTSQCPHCQGTGIIRSTESVALAVLRGLEDAVMAGARTPLVATTTAQVALYILNNKRAFIIDMEQRLGLPIVVQGSDKMQGANFTIEKGAAPAQAQRRPERSVVSMDWGFEDEDEAEGEAAEAASDDGETDAAAEHGDGNGQEGGRRRRRRRRRGRRGERSEGESLHGHSHDGDHGEDRVVEIREVGDADEDDEPELIDNEGAGGSDEPRAGRSEDGEGEGDGEGRRRRGRRRGRRGGRRGRDRGDRAPMQHGDDASLVDQRSDDESPDEADASPGDIAGTGPQPDVDQSTGEAAPRRRAAEARPPRRERQPRHHDRRPAQRPDTEPARHEPEDAAHPAPEARSEPESAPDVPAPPHAPEPVAAPAAETTPEPAPRPRGEPVSSEPKLERVVVRPDQTEGDAVPASAASAPTRRGWWQRRLGGE